MAQTKNAPKKAVKAVSAQYAQMTTQELESALSEMQTALADKKKAQADDVVKEVVAKILEYAEFFSAYDKRKIAKAIGFEEKTEVSGAKKNTDVVSYKYQLDDGEVWTGKGRMPNAFKAWKKANPDKDFPIHPSAKRVQEAVAKATTELENVK